MRKLAISSLLLLSFGLTACSNQQLYKFGQNVGTELAECDTRITASDRASCHASRSMSFAEYQAQRAKLKHDAASHDHRGDKTNE